MFLSKEQEKMYDGERGEPIRKAMEILVAIGDTYDAEKLIPVNKAHVAGLSYKTHGDPGLDYVQTLSREGASVSIPTTLNVIGIDRYRWRELNLPEEWSGKQLSILEAYQKMGCTGSCSCTPYYNSCIPRFKEHIAWAESSAVVCSNSLLGARDNREGGPSALASALTGLTPYYGYHMDENRHGNVHVKIDGRLTDLSSYGALGVYVGRAFGESVPVFEGMRGDAPFENLVALGAGLASSGAVALYHSIGLTPEANSLEEAFGGEAPEEKVRVGDEELEEAGESLSTTSEDDVEFVSIGCPHCSLNQIKEVAELLQGRKVDKDVKFWIYTSVPMRHMAEKMGYLGPIEKAGAVVTSDACTVLGCPESLGFKSVVTNSSKMAFYAPGSNGLDVLYGSVRECVSAAVNGKWRAEK